MATLLMTTELYITALLMATHDEPMHGIPRCVAYRHPWHTEMRGYDRMPGRMESEGYKPEWNHKDASQNGIRRASHSAIARASGTQFLSASVSG